MVREGSAQGSESITLFKYPMEDYSGNYSKHPQFGQLPSSVADVAVFGVSHRILSASEQSTAFKSEVVPRPCVRRKA